MSGLSAGARWLLSYIGGASQGVDGRMLEAGSNAKTLQKLVDSRLVFADQKRRYRLTSEGKALQ